MMLPTTGRLDNAASRRSSDLSAACASDTRGVNFNSRLIRSIGEPPNSTSFSDTDRPPFARHRFRARSTALRDIDDPIGELFGAGRSSAGGGADGKAYRSEEHM